MSEISERKKISMSNHSGLLNLKKKNIKLKLQIYEKINSISVPSKQREQIKFLYQEVYIKKCFD